MKSCTLTFSALALMLLASVPAAPQQINGTLGSPSATTTIDGKQLPPPPLPTRPIPTTRLAA
jgi:hypothetical protein